MLPLDWGEVDVSTRSWPGIPLGSTRRTTTSERPELSGSSAHITQLAPSSVVSTSGASVGGWSDSGLSRSGVLSHAAAPAAAGANASAARTVTTASAARTLMMRTYPPRCGLWEFSAALPDGHHQRLRTPGAATRLGHDARELQMGAVHRPAVDADAPLAAREHVTALLLLEDEAVAG